MTNMFSVTGHLVLLIPVGWGKSEGANTKLPVAIQLVSKRFCERKLFFAASCVGIPWLWV